MLCSDDTVYIETKTHADCHIAIDSDSLLLSQTDTSKLIRYVTSLAFLLLTFCKRKSTMSVF